jgi:hypothetical protein
MTTAPVTREDLRAGTAWRIDPARTQGMAKTPVALSVRARLEESR